MEKIWSNNTKRYGDVSKPYLWSMTSPCNLDPKPHFIVIMLLLGIFCLVGGTQNLTIHSPDGDIIDCINILSQPAFYNPLLRNHNFEETPTSFPGLIINTKDDLNWQIWHRHGLSCPEGTIPIRRIVSRQNKTMYPISAAKATRGHEHAIAMTHDISKIFGTKVTMNVWHPKVERVDEFSLGQVWLGSGSYESENLNTIEAGWQVCPKLYSDYQPRFFILWTSDEYHRNTCVNLICGGFIQTSRSILLGGAISPALSVGRSQIEITIHIWKDPELDLWWLGVGFDDTIVTPVGYWPVEIFTRLTDYAEYVQWGGEIINRNSSGRHTRTEMGSGYLPNTGKAALMCGIEIATNSTCFEPYEDPKLIMTNKDYYKVKRFNDTCFSYGGPERAEALSLRLDLIVLILCFSIFLLF